MAKADHLFAAGHMLLADPTSLNWQKLSERWEDHKAKSRQAVFADLLAREVFILGNVEGVDLEAQQEGNEAAALRVQREAALYVDWDNGVQRPSTAITEEQAREQIEIAGMQLQAATAMTGECRGLTPERARELIAAPAPPG